MALAKRGDLYHLRIRPFPGTPLIGVKTPARTKQQARQIEMAVLTACSTRDYRGLDPVSREVCVCMFRNQGWELPADLSGAEERGPREELTLWKATELFLKDPRIRDKPTRRRYEYCLVHLADKLGKNRPVKSLWVPDLEQYQDDRLKEGAAAASINWELATLSKIFGVLSKHQLVKDNPVRLVERLSTRESERQVYLSREDVCTIIEKCPQWSRPIIRTAYYTGMRRGEILELTRNRVNLSRRIITLSPADTKENHWKRIPIHEDLVPILHEAMKVSCLGKEIVFLLQDGKGIRPLGLETFKNIWPRACKALELEPPLPRFHDLRHTWRTNARRSGLSDSIAESILGHWFKQKTVNERYGRISNDELVAFIDGMTFDHGETEICGGSGKRERAVYKMCTNAEKTEGVQENQEVAANLSS